MDWIVPQGALASAPAYMAFAAAAVMLIGLSKGGFGGGVGVLATPLMLFVVPGPVAISLVLPLLIVCDFLTLRHFPREWARRSVWMLVPGTVAGLGVGFFCLYLFARDDIDANRWIRAVVGVSSLGFCVLQCIRGWLSSRKPAAEESAPFHPGPGVSFLCGTTSGLTTMVAHAAGPVISMYLLPQRLSPADFVGTNARYFFWMNLSKVPLYLLAGRLAAGRDYITVETLRCDLWLLPFCPVGVALGAWLNRRMSGALFTRIIYVFLAITGVKMIYDACMI